MRRGAQALTAPASAGEAQLRAGLAAMPLLLDEAAVRRLLRYLDELVKWNRAYNLTAIREPQEMITRHLLDSLVLADLVCGRVLDVGAGAGLPGIPLAIARPALQVTLLDSNGKKARFMRHVTRTLDLVNVEVVEGRVEAYRPAAGFDCVLSRAFASLAEFFRLTAHLLAPGGQWIAMKGKLDAEELAAAAAEGQIRETRRLQVPGLDEDRHVVIASAKP